MIEVQFSQDLNLDAYQSTKLRVIEKALFASTYEMMRRARNDMRGSGYRLDEVANGIVVGSLKKYGDTERLTLHAFGTGEHANLARIFVGGTIERKGTSKYGKPYTKGYIKATNSIDDSLDESLLNQYIKNAIDNG